MDRGPGRPVWRGRLGAYQRFRLAAICTARFGAPKSSIRSKAIFCARAEWSAAVKAFLAATGGITDRVMAAMEEADATGGDSRCTCQFRRAPGAPRFPAPSVRHSWHTYWRPIPKYQRACRISADSHNNGKYAMYLTFPSRITVVAFQIKPGEDLDPVKNAAHAVRCVDQGAPGVPAVTRSGRCRRFD